MFVTWCQDTAKALAVVEQGGFGVTKARLHLPEAYCKSRRVGLYPENVSAFGLLD